MKIFAAALAGFTTVAMAADPINLFTYKNETAVAYTDTFNKTGTRYSMMFGYKTSTTERREFLSVDSTTCERKYGSLYSRQSEHVSWKYLDNVIPVVRSEMTHGDHMAFIICVTALSYNVINNTKN